MSSEQNTVLLGELISHRKGYAFKSKDYVDVGVPVVRVSNFTDDSISRDDLRFVPASIATINRNVILRANDIVVATVGSWPNNPASVVGRTISVPKWAENALMNQNSVIIRSKSASLMDQCFIYYQMKSKEFSSHVVSKAQGSANQASITLDAIFSFPLLWPKSEVRASVVTILNALNDRISLLRETNTTLEAIAQALFKSWFVDFDPVRAKAEGGLPEGIDAATAALFPDAFEETELGLVPRGWSVKCLSVFITESTRRIGDEPAIVLSAVQTGNLVMSSDFFNKRVHSKDISKYKAVEPYSYAYNPSRINIGSIGINEMGVVGAVSPIYVVANPKNISFGYYLWHLLRTNRIRESIKTMSSGTVRQSLAFKDFASLKVALPADEIVNQFFEVRDEIFKNINLKENQISVLLNLRDTLLPRLISGQLRIADAEAELEKAIA